MARRAAAVSSPYLRGLSTGVVTDGQASDVQTVAHCVRIQRGPHQPCCVHRCSIVTVIHVTYLPVFTWAIMLITPR